MRGLADSGGSTVESTAPDPLSAEPNPPLHAGAPPTADEAARSVVPLDAHLARIITGWVGSLADVVQFGGPDLPWPLSVDDLLATTRDPGRRVLVLLDGSGAPVATGSFLARPPVARIGRVLVAPQRRREGWGRVVMETLIERAAAERGIESITLGVYAHNTAARTLYARLGFGDTDDRHEVDVGGEHWMSLGLVLPVHCGARLSPRAPA